MKKKMKKENGRNKKRSIPALSKWEIGKIEKIATLRLQKGFLLDNIKRQYIGTTSEKRLDSAGIEIDFIHYVFEYKFNISHKDNRNKVYHSGSILTNASKKLRIFANKFLKDNNFFGLASKNKRVKKGKK